MAILEELQKIGLSEKEAQVYLACLEGREISASQIAFKTRIHRTLVYDILNKLKEIGLVSFIPRENRKYFNAASPYALLATLKEKESIVKKILPKLHEIEGLQAKSTRVAVFEGKEGMKTVMNDILSLHPMEFIGFGSSRSSVELIPAFMKQWHQSRVRKGIGMRFIYNNTTIARERVKLLPKKLTQYRFMPIPIPLPTSTIVYGDKILLQSWKSEPFSVVIQNQDMAENNRQYFEQLWRIAKK